MRCKSQASVPSAGKKSGSQAFYLHGILDRYEKGYAVWSLTTGKDCSGPGSNCQPGLGRAWPSLSL